MTTQVTPDARSTTRDTADAATHAALATLDRRGSSRADDGGVPTPEALRDAGVLRDVDVHFARHVAHLTDERDPLVLLGLAVASRAPGAGHVCAELDACDRLVRLERPAPRGRAAAVRWPDPITWRDALAASAAVCVADGDGARRAPGDGTIPGHPLVLDGTRLYLARYWAYQCRLLAALRARAASRRDDVDEAALAAGLDRLFPAASDVSDAAVSDRQRAAAAAAVRRALAVVTGGPGTGKTTSVLRVLVLLVEQALARGEPVPRIVLAAPTGKAAARLAESVAGGLRQLGTRVDADVAAWIPTEARTLHRVLGWQPRTPTRFRHGTSDPLAADVVVVDECSMVPLSLMAKLLDAVPPGARLVLLGDSHQLASVEAGSILADVCGDAVDDGSGPGTVDAGGDRAEPMKALPRPAIADCVVRLTVSHRFRADGGIGRIAAAVNAGDPDAVLAALGAARRAAPSDSASAAPTDAADAVGGDEVRFEDLAAETAVGGERAAAACVGRVLARTALPAYRRLARADGPNAALDALEAVRVLAAHREGAFGVAGLNQTVVAALVAERSMPSDAVRAPWFHGQPVLVTENDPALELSNGDVGVVLRDGGGALRVWFRRADRPAGVRAVTPARLPAHETTFATTVHKAQGSEFADVVLVLPPRPSPVLTRELLYTGLTRARRRVTVVGTAPVIRAAVRDRVQRASGLRVALWAADRPLA